MGSDCFTEKEAPIPDPINCDNHHLTEDKDRSYKPDPSCRCIQGGECNRKIKHHYCRCLWSSGINSCFADVHNCRCRLPSFICRRHTQEFKASSTDDLCCIICFENYDHNKTSAVSLIPCKHHYHNICIKRWFSRGHTNCPICSVRVF